MPEQTTLSPEAMDMAEAFSELHIDDIDTDDFDNPQLCAEYVKDIYKYIREQEVCLQTRSRRGEYCFFSKRCYIKWMQVT